MIPRRNTRTTTLFEAISAATLPLALAALGTTLSIGCTVDAGDSLFVLHNKPLSTECEVLAEKGTQFIPRGLIDISIASSYTFTPLIESRTRVIDETDPLERAILIGGAEIEIELPSDVTGAAELLSTTQRFSGTIEAGGLAAFTFEIISPELTTSLGNAIVGKTVLADVTVFGELGNGTVESPQFTYPVRFCDGCLVQNCATYVPPESRSCLPGQDFYEANCCNDNGELVCPAPDPNEETEQ